MTFDFEYIEKITKLLNDSNLTEMILQDGEQVIELRKQVCAAPMVAAPALASTVTSTVLPAQPVAQPVEEKSSPKEPENLGKPITSPMVGTFYSASSPTAKPFVQVGDSVSVGEVVCIVEAMKLMNEIEAEVSGKITKICVENGQPVEYGQVLMYVE